jgi:hypothetical protein
MIGLKLRDLKVLGGQQPQQHRARARHHDHHVDQVLRDDPFRRCGSESRLARGFRIATDGFLAARLAFCRWGRGLCSHGIPRRWRVRPRSGPTLTLSLSDFFPDLASPSHARGPKPLNGLVNQS